ncbi:hypothetical protein [Vitiosangium sp. GDMCC 1.1324]|uniref:hypothetical protein n=1 Tax=Vitiosangium sp. (strain GDMCC 1.1324) TaxID=2138576 RepID=UPI000D3C34BE|nr:hypothetical protein [Vitiosangium sp. GDMCC 1.1324]PTL79966.1 hypothetical protein DAT35_31590 [Vitiosangium sp. GDMCC 1.1324]
MRTHELLVVGLMIASPVSLAQADSPTYVCGSGDRGAGARDIPWNTDEWRELQRAVLRYCARGAAVDPQRHCKYVVPLVKHGHCAFEFYEANASTPACIALGRHSDAPELSWHAELERVRGRWRVHRLLFDDLERP